MQVGKPGNNPHISALTQKSIEVKEHLSGLGSSSKHSLTQFEGALLQCSALVYVLSLFM